MLGKSQTPRAWLLFSSLPPPPIWGQAWPEHPEAGVDCEGGGAPEFLYRGPPQGQKAQGHLPSREFKGCPGSQWIYEQVKWTGAKKGLCFPLPRSLLLGSLPHQVCRLSRQKLLHSPSLPPLSLFWCEGFTITAL